MRRREFLQRSLAASSALALGAGGGLSSLGCSGDAERVGVLYPRLLLHGFRLFDGVEDQLLDDRVILVHGDRIEAVEPHVLDCPVELLESFPIRPRPTVVAALVELRSDSVSSDPLVTNRQLAGCPELIDPVEDDLLRRIALGRSRTVKTGNQQEREEGQGG